MLVTLIDANHVPGAVMILIKGYFGNILYTGDFRYNVDMLDVRALKVLIHREDLDLVYLDNTYFYSTCDFPSRAEVQERIVKLICDHPCHKIFIGTYKLGKESLLVDLALRLNERILVSSEKLLQLEVMDLPDVFTIDPMQSRIRCVHAPLLHRRFLERENRSQYVLGIKLTALYYGWDMPEKAPFSAGSDYNLHVFAYSDHSSYSELFECVSALKPKEVKPIISSTKAVGLLKNWTSFHEQRVNFQPFEPHLSKLPPKFMSRPADVSNDLNSEPSRKKRKTLNVVKESVYRGPKGPVYESSPSSIIDTLAEKDHFLLRLENLSNIRHKVSRTAVLKEISKSVRYQLDLLIKD